MRPTDPTCLDGAAIIPFVPLSDKKATDDTHETVSTIVAVVAVTLRHASDISPEEGLADLIEATGEAEIIEIQDACTEIFDNQTETGLRLPQFANDN